MWWDLIILLVLLVALYWGYKGWGKLKWELHEIYAKFDTIYYMLCDILRKRHDRQTKKKGKK